jgi:hypothetical protein
MQPYATKGIRRSIKFESQFFVHYGMTYDNFALTPDDVCTLRQQYQQEFIASSSSSSSSSSSLRNNSRTNTTPSIRPSLSPLDDNVLTFEKSPIYLCKPHLPSLIYQVAPWTKIIVLLRNPIHRVFSQWKMEQSQTLFFANRQNAQLLNDAAAAAATSPTTSNGTHVQKPQPDLVVPVYRSFIDRIDTEIIQLRKYGLSRAPKLSVYVNMSLPERNKVKVFRVPKSIQERCIGLQRLQPQQLSENGPPRNDTFDQRRKLMASPLSRGIYSQQLYFWLQKEHGGIGPYRLGESIKIIQYEHSFVQNQTHTLQETMEFVGMPWRKYKNGTKVIPDHDLFDVDHSPGKYTVEERKSMWQSKTKGSQRRHANGTTVPTLTTLDSVMNIKSNDDLVQMKMDEVVREYLYKFYQPYNDELVLLLGNQWANVWK